MTDTLPALEDDPLRHARHLVRAATKASLATLMAKPDEGAPYASLVIIAADHDGAPLLLLSDLAEHSANIARNGRVSLLIDGTAGFEDPLTGPRVSVTGVARRSREARHRTRYLARHPSAERYADFGWAAARLDDVRGELCLSIHQAMHCWSFARERVCVCVIKLICRSLTAGSPASKKGAIAPPAAPGNAKGHTSPRRMRRGQRRIM